MLKVSIGSFFSYLAFGLTLVQPFLLPVSLICLAMAKGYLLRVMRTVLNGEDALLPAWNDWLDLVISGISFIVIELGFAFSFLCFSLFTIIIKFLILQTSADGTSLLAFTQGHYLLLALLFGGSNLFTSVLMVNFAQEESMKSGFQWLRVIKRIQKEPLAFATAWLSGIGFSALALVPGITIIGLLVVPFAYFLSQLVGARLLATIWAYLNAQTSDKSQPAN